MDDSDMLGSSPGAPAKYLKNISFLLLFVVSINMSFAAENKCTIAQKITPKIFIYTTGVILTISGACMLNNNWGFLAFGAGLSTIVYKLVEDLGEIIGCGIDACINECKKKKTVKPEEQELEQ